MDHINTRQSLLDKLKPSTKNRLMGKKIRTLGTTSPDRRHSINSTNKDIDLHFELQQSIVMNEKNVDVSFISVNMEEINDIIGKYMGIILDGRDRGINENIFLRLEYHSILPFLFISSTNVHRMCVSDFEIKFVLKTYHKKHKDKKLEYFDIYRLGLLYFLKGNYHSAYFNFRASYMLTLKEKFKNLDFEANIAKWYILSGLIILFCEKRVDFSKMKNIKLNYTNGENFGSSLFFGCCSVRKPNQSFLFNGDLDGLPFNKADPKSVASEIEELLKLVKSNERNMIEI
jgi:hypothetical protein